MAIVSGHTHARASHSRLRVVDATRLKMDWET